MELLLSDLTRIYDQLCLGIPCNVSPMDLLYYVDDVIIIECVVLTLEGDKECMIIHLMLQLIYYLPRIKVLM